MRQSFCSWPSRAEPPRSLSAATGFPGLRTGRITSKPKALKEGIPLVTVKQAMTFLQSGTHVILDARPAADYEAGHIPTALSVPYDSVADAMVKAQQYLTPSQPIMTYCSGKNCDESFLLTQYLRRQGFTNVVLFAGGFETWSAEGYPIERGGR